MKLFVVQTFLTTTLQATITLVYTNYYFHTNLYGCIGTYLIKTVSRRRIITIIEGAIEDICTVSETRTSVPDLLHGGVLQTCGFVNIVEATKEKCIKPELKHEGIDDIY